MRASLLLALTAAILAGADDGCGDPDCIDRVILVPSLAVEFESPCWPDGNYEVRGALDGVPFSIPVVLPAPEWTAFEDGLATVIVSAERGIERLEVTPEDWDRPPAVVDLQIEYEGAGLLDETIEPPYRRGDPDTCGHQNPVARVPATLPPASRQLLCDPPAP